MTQSKRVTLALCGALLVCACAMAVGASGKGLQERLDATQGKLSHVKAHAGVLTTRISHESAQLDRLTAEVADLRKQEATVAAELAQKQAELEQAQARLDHLKQRLGEAVQILEQRLVAIYESNEPDLITVLLQSHGFDDLLARTQYMRDPPGPGQRHRRQGARTPQRDAGHRQHRARGPRRDRGAKAAARGDQAGAAAADRGARHGPPQAARHADAGPKAAGGPRGRPLAISRRRSPSSSAQQTGALPAGPIRPGGHGLIWPVNGPVVSGFGMRWGRMHEGIDIAVPTGTQIRAAASGTVSIAGVGRAATGTTPASITAAGSPPATPTRSGSWSPPDSRWHRPR